MKEIIAFILHGEDIKLTAYPGMGGVWHIGIGSTFYEDGRPVREGDKITPEAAYSLTAYHTRDIISFVQNQVRTSINQNQLMALASFCYNIGKRNFLKSNILRMINQDANDPRIADQFPENFVTNDCGTKTPGLVNRRISEARKYFSYTPEASIPG